MSVRLLYLGLLLGSLVGACRKAALQHEQDVAACQAYAEDRNIPALQDTDADYFYYFYVANNNPNLVLANEGLTLKVRYRAELLDGTLVDDTGADSALIQLDESIYGWRLALPRMGIGERMLLVLYPQFRGAIGWRCLKCLARAHAVKTMCTSS